MPDNIYFVLVVINKYSGVPGLLYFLFYLTKKQGYTRIVFFILLASFLADFSNYFFIRYVYKNSFIISNTWYLLNFLLVSWYFYLIIPNWRKLIIGLMVVFITSAIISFGLYYEYTQPNTFVKSLTSVSFSIVSLLCLFEILRESPTDQLRTYPVFWVVTALFLYSSITLFRNLFQNYFLFGLEIGPNIRYLHLFNFIFNIGKNLAFLYAFILVNKGYPDYIHQPKSVTHD